jgi:membrane dipeptidase
MSAVVVEEVSDVAKRLDVSEEAVALYRASDVIDLHLDTFIWRRIFGYDLHKKHTGGPLGRHFMGHTDFPRALEAGITGGCWVITTNPFRRAARREAVFRENLTALKAEIEKASDRITHVRTAADYRAARAANKHAAFIAIQGGNALDASRDAIDVLANGDVTVVHLTGSSLGGSSAPWPFANDALTAAGKEHVVRLNAMKVLVDLAHIGRKSFFDAVDAHAKDVPIVVTHTGVEAVHPHWRNLTDEQVRAIAKSGGFIGIMLQESFLGRPPVTLQRVVDHIEHVIKIAGEDTPALGSDYDGMISPPASLPTPMAYPRIVDEMRKRKMPARVIEKFLGKNVLRVIEQVRG